MKLRTTLVVSAIALAVSVFAPAASAASVTVPAADGTFVPGEYVLASGSSVSINPNAQYVFDGTLPPDMRMVFRQTGVAWTVSISRQPGTAIYFR